MRLQTGLLGCGPLIILSWVITPMYAKYLFRQQLATMALARKQVFHAGNGRSPNTSVAVRGRSSVNPFGTFKERSLVNDVESRSPTSAHFVATFTADGIAVFGVQQQHVIVMLICFPAM